MLRILTIISLIFFSLYIYGQRQATIRFDLDDSGKLMCKNNYGNLISSPSIIGNLTPRIPNERIEVYQTLENLYSSIKWEIIGGVINSGQNTSSVNVNWHNNPPHVLKARDISTFGCPSEWAELIITPAEIQNIPLDQGWNLISTYMNLYDSSIVETMNTIDPKLERVKDEFGTYFHNQPPPFNTLSNLTDGQGYWVRVSNNADLEIAGLPHPLSSVTIPLIASPNWNLIGYTGEIAMPVEQAFASIMPHIEKIKNVEESFDPSFPPVFNTLKFIEPGKGYWIKVSQPLAFSYPEPSNGLIKGDIQAKNFEDLPEHWRRITYTNSMIVYGSVIIDESPFLEDGFVGVFVDGECRATNQIKNTTDSSFVSLVINSEVEENLEFRLWDGQNEYVSETSLLSVPGGESIDILPIKFNSVYTSIEEEIDATKISIYPNPTTERIFLQDVHKIFKRDFDILLYDNTGKNVPISYDKNQHSFGLEIIPNTPLIAGIYTIIIKDEKQTINKKVLIMK